MQSSLVQEFCVEKASFYFQDMHLLKKALGTLSDSYSGVVKLAKERKQRLEEARNLFQFLADAEEEEAWVLEKQRICASAVTPKDHRAVMSLLQKHKAMEDEIKARRPKVGLISELGRQLIEGGKGGASEAALVDGHLRELGDRWRQLDDMVAARRKQLMDAAEAFAFNADANEAESWVKEKRPLADSTDYGTDENSGMALLQLHNRLEEEMGAYRGDIRGLEAAAQRLAASGIVNLSLNKPSVLSQDTAEADEFETVEETQLVPEEVVEEVPHEYVQEKYVTQVKEMPTVKAKYAFEGQGMAMVKGEEMVLLAKTNEDWWNIRKLTGEEGFVPANYVREGEPREVQFKVKQLEKVREVRKQVKKVLVKKVVPVKRRKARARKAPKDEVQTETVEERLKAVTGAFAELEKAAALRRTLLQDAIALFAFYGECSAFDNWMRDKEKSLKEEEIEEEVEAARRKFEKLLTDLSAANKRIVNIDAMVKGFEKEGHSQIGNIKARQKQIHDHWDHLQRLKQQKERSIEGASSAELFRRTCQETRDWMVEKMAQMATEDLGRDLKTIQHLQRKHDQLQRELAPVQEKVTHVEALGSTVVASYPGEAPMVRAELAKVHEMWEEVKKSAQMKRNRLQEAVGCQVFLNSCSGLLAWLGGVKQQLNCHDVANDVATAELLLKSHAELGDDLRAHQEEFGDTLGLGEKLKEMGGQGEVAGKLEQLNAEREAIHRGWQEKEDFLQQCLDLQLFNREADQIDVTTAGHEAILGMNDVGDTLDGVEAMLKRHGELESTLGAQHEKLAAFSVTADKLIEAQHYEAPKIDGRRRKVVKRREDVKDKAEERRQSLQSSLAYQQFKADADDFARWIGDKQKVADDESYKDMANLERKLQKHEALQRELSSNESQLRNINKNGEGLINMDHYRRIDIRRTLDNLNKAWEKVCGDAKGKGQKLRQAFDQHNYNKDLSEVDKSLDSLSSDLDTADVGSDLRSCKKLINQQAATDKDIKQTAKKINDLEAVGQTMIDQDHFDAKNIAESCKNLKVRYESLEGPARLRRAALDESLKFYQFGFQVEAEMQWINEHMPAATSTVLGKNLHEAQKFSKKHLKLQEEIKGHQTMIDKAINIGEEYIGENHPQKEKIRSLCDELNSKWDNLCAAAAQRRKILDLSLKAQQYFFEANEIESWLNEKKNLLSTTDYGRDEDGARKLLARHKVGLLDILNVN